MIVKVEDGTTFPESYITLSSENLDKVTNDFWSYLILTRILITIST